MHDSSLTAHLMEIANDSELRQVIYEHMGEYCHQCRNRLNSLKLCLYLAKRQSAPSGPVELEILEQRYAALERSIDLVQTLCRPMPLALSSLGLSLLIQDRLPRWSPLAVNHDVEIECIPPGERDVVHFDPDRMGQALDSLVDWRVAQLEAGSTARMSWKVNRGMARIIWEETTNAFSPRPKVPESTHAWALPLITRVVEAHSGEVEVFDRDSWRLELRWPAGPRLAPLATAN